MKREYPVFGLTLVVNHACNLRCTYCYTGKKFHSPMPVEMGIEAITKALRCTHEGGALELGFFGGEPLLEPGRILEWMRTARELGGERGVDVRFHLTTNGTLNQDAAWEVMSDPDMETVVSCDGLPSVHDRHRPFKDGHGSITAVATTLGRLQDAGRELRVNFVVHPGNVESLTAGLIWLQTHGVCQVDLSLDLWQPWPAKARTKLEEALMESARLWHAWLPGFSLNWFDAKLAGLAGLPTSQPDARCGFGCGEVTVTPSGRLYPCERLVGEDRPENPIRLPIDLHELEDFSEIGTRHHRLPTACADCALLGACDTNCRCSNYVRTGDPTRPDGLLCRLNKTAARAVAAAVATGFQEEEKLNERSLYAIK